MAARAVTCAHGTLLEQPSLRVALPLLACALAPRPLGRSALAQIGPSGIVGDLEGIQEVLAHARHVDAELGEQLVRDAPPSVIIASRRCASSGRS